MSKASTSPKVRKIAGVFAGLAICAGAIGMLAPAVMAPGPPAELAPTLQVSANETYRKAAIDAFAAQGYEILPAVEVVDVSSLGY